MDHRNNVGSAPDFTNAFLVSLGGLLYVFLLALLAIWGMIAVFAFSFVANKVIGRPKQAAQGSD